MKRKILSLILVLMLIPVASIFSACGKDKGYDLNNLDDEYNQIAIENNNIISNAGRLEFNYDNHGDFKTIVSTTEPYDQLVNYNIVFNNLMSFANEYISVCSNNDIVENVEVKNKVKADFDQFKQSVADVNGCTNMFAEIINLSKNVNVKAEACLTRYENLLQTYDIMFQRAITFNNTLSNLYFNNILKDGNPNVYAINVNNFDSSIVINKLKSRISYQKSLISQCFIELYIDGGLATQIAKNSVDLNLDMYNYRNMISYVSPYFDEQLAVEKANNNANKNTFYNLAVKAQNIQATLNNDNAKFVYSCNAVQYCKVVANSNASAQDKMCADIIESYFALVVNYNEVVSSMINIIKN